MAPDPKGRQSGVTGEVSIRPIRPHVTKGQPSSEPYQATIEVLDQNRHQVAVAKSDADGRFTVLLPPGKYILRPQTEGTYPRASEQTVTVNATSLSTVRIVYDTGMR